ncbi:hypothetical protein K5X82_12315 [Halosquirtibacter xylanolyticus]|uniref:hypothetical protein n=1 Tax=Halosquirtibacter xylanolyticus TaxID=3374599 RepID=UPI00374A5DBF|nr:hypothetical protein K5X82_12315 [Prolixibacteraceae bacterium]
MKTSIPTQYSVSSLLLSLFQSKHTNNQETSRISQWAKVSDTLENSAKNVRTMRLISVGILLTTIVLSLSNNLNIPSYFNVQSIVGTLVIFTFCLSLLEQRYIQRAQRIQRYIFSR